MNKHFANLLLRFIGFVINSADSANRLRFVDQIKTLLLSFPVLYGPKERLIVSERVSQANTLFNTRSGTINVGVGVMFGHNCMVLTGVHDYSKPGETRSRVTLEDVARDIFIEDGVWVASGVIIVGPCRIGKNAVIAAGSVVKNDIPPMVLAAGNPAKIIKHIEINSS